MLYPHQLSQEQGADGIDVVLNSLSNLAVVVPKKMDPTLEMPWEIPGLDMFGPNLSPRSLEFTARI